MPSNIIRQRNEGESTILSDGEAEILYKGNIGALLRMPMLVDRGHGYIKKDFQKFVRTPGVRIIAIEDEKILLTKEFRHELNDFDYRLPGGKVFDAFDDFLPYMTTGKEIPHEQILKAARAELQEEASKDSKSLTILKNSHSGASIGWDLYYIVAQDITDFKDETENEGEQIESVEWKSFSEVEEMCLDGEISEDRTAATLLQFIHRQK